MLTLYSFLNILLRLRASQLGLSLSSPEDLRQRIVAYYGTLDDPMVFPTPLVALGPGGLDTLLNQAIHPFLDAPVTLGEDEFLYDVAGQYKVIRDILGCTM